MQILYFAIAIAVSATLGWFGGSMYGAKACVADRNVKNAEGEDHRREGPGEHRPARRQARVERAQDKAASDPIQQEIANDVQANPAPPECVTPARRLSRLNALVDQANAAAGVHERGAAAKAAADGQAGRGGAWIADAAPKYRDLAKDYHCLQDWATRTRKAMTTNSVKRRYAWIPGQAGSARPGLRAAHRADRCRGTST
jgi:hypothetical protein